MRLRARRESTFFVIFWREFLSLIKLNVLFVLTCLPVVTIPASLTALSRVTQNMDANENHFLCSAYFRCFKREFWRSLAAGAVVATALAASLCSVRFYFLLAMRHGNAFVLLVGMGLVLAVLSCMAGTYVFQMLALVDLPLIALLKNAVLLVFVCIKRSLLNFLIQGAVLFFWLLLFPGSSLFAAAILFSAMSLIATHLLSGGLRGYVLCGERAASPAQRNS